MLDKSLIPIVNLLALNLSQAQNIELLRQAAEKIESYKGLEAYFNALNSLNKEVRHE